MFMGQAPFNFDLRTAGRSPASHPAAKPLPLTQNDFSGKAVLGPKTYTVNPDPETPFCNCRDFEFRRARCKHVLAVEIVLQREVQVLIKSKFGERLRSKNETAQVNEALTKVLAHNLCVVIQSMYELDITPEFRSEAA